MPVCCHQICLHSNGSIEMQAQPWYELPNSCKEVFAARVRLAHRQQLLQHRAADVAAEGVPLAVAVEVIRGQLTVKVKPCHTSSIAASLRISYNKTGHTYSQQQSTDGSE